MPILTLQSLSDKLTKIKITEDFLKTTNSEYKLHTFKTGKHLLLNGINKILSEDIIIQWMDKLIEKSSPFSKINKTINHKFQKMTRTKIFVIFVLFGLYIKGLNLFFKKSKKTFFFC
jgi:hypothetical protein